MPIELAAKLPGPVAYVLGGGASYGSVQVGQIRALARTDLAPDLVVGTSVGALNGAVVAEDPQCAPDRLLDLWLNVKREDIFGKSFSTAVNLASRRAAVSHAGLQALVEASLEARDFDDLTLPHTAMTTDFGSGESVPLRTGELVPALLASASIPLVFPAVEHQGRTLVDGGLVANVPIMEAAAQGANTIVVFDPGLTVMPPSSDNTLTSRLLRMAAIMAAQQVRRELFSSADKYVLYVPGPWPVPGRPDEFKHSAEIAENAYSLAMEWLVDLQPTGPGKYGKAPGDALIETAESARPASTDPDVTPADN